jgi:hypothetical protein
MTRIPPPAETRICADLIFSPGSTGIESKKKMVSGFPKFTL